MKSNLENVFDRSRGELGGDTFVPTPSLLERNVRCSGDDVSSDRHRRKSSRWSSDSHRFNQRAHCGGADSLQNRGRHDKPSWYKIDQLSNWRNATRWLWIGWWSRDLAGKLEGNGVANSEFSSGLEEHVILVRVWALIDGSLWPIWELGHNGSPSITYVSNFYFGKNGFLVHRSWACFSSRL